MIDRDDPQEIDRYGFGPWLVGTALSALMTFFMFFLAAGFA